MPSLTGVQTCARSEEHTSELQSLTNLVCRLLLEKKNKNRLRGRSHESRAAAGSAHDERVVPNIAGLHTAPLICMFLLHLCQALFFFFFNDTATTEIYTLSLHDALPI